MANLGASVARREEETRRKASMGAKAYIKLLEGLAKVAKRIQTNQSAGDFSAANDDAEPAQAPTGGTGDGTGKEKADGEKTKAGGTAPEGGQTGPNTGQSDQDAALRNEYANKREQAEHARADAEQLPGGNKPGSLPPLPSENPEDVDPQALQDAAAQAKKAAATPSPEERGRPRDAQTPKAAGVPARPQAETSGTGNQQENAGKGEENAPEEQSDEQEGGGEPGERPPDPARQAQKQAQEHERSRKLREAKQKAKSPSKLPGGPGELPGMPGGAPGAGLTEGVPGLGAGGAGAAGAGAAGAGAGGAASAEAGAVARLALRNPYVIAILAAVGVIVLVIVLILIPTFTAPIAACTVGSNQIPKEFRPECETFAGKENIEAATKKRD